MPQETIYDNYAPEENKTYFNGDIEEVEPKGITINITKTSSIDEWVWIVTVDGAEFKQTRESYNWGNKVKPTSYFTTSILSKITGIAIKDKGQYSGYALGANQIRCDYVEGANYDSEFWTPEELKEYIIKTVAAIRAKIKETDTTESVTFKV